MQAWIERDRRYLILKRNQEPFRGRWDLPGGFVEMGESPTEAVIREVLEETGLAVVPTSVIGAFRSAYGTDGRYTVDVAFRCRLDGGEFSLDAGEKLDCAWVALDEMPELAFDGEREALAALREPPA